MINKDMNNEISKLCAASFGLSTNRMRCLISTLDSE